MILVDETYKMTKGFPDVEKFNLVSQLIRCAVSIPSNIAEGTSKSTNKHFNKYIECSLGSSFEWETQLTVCYRQKFLSEDLYVRLEEKVQVIQSKISNFIDKLE